MESMRLLITSSVFCPTPPEEFFPVLGEFIGGGYWPPTSLPRASQTCSIGFMSGEYAGHSSRWIPSSKGNPPPG
ncbi:hypothetical protein TNCV_677721 [Trichonephila clavipes]|nr:hypothetical protein TNCV_677721 [Trichonephila clavipes]